MKRTFEFFRPKNEKKLTAPKNVLEKEENENCESFDFFCNLNLKNPILTDQLLLDFENSPTENTRVGKIKIDKTFLSQHCNYFCSEGSKTINELLKKANFIFEESSQIDEDKVNNILINLMIHTKDRETEAFHLQARIKNSIYFYFLKRKFSLEQKLFSLCQKTIIPRGLISIFISLIVETQNNYEPIVFIAIEYLLLNATLCSASKIFVLKQCFMHFNEQKDYQNSNGNTILHLLMLGQISYEKKYSGRIDENYYEFIKACCTQYAELIDIKNNADKTPKELSQQCRNDKIKLLFHNDDQKTQEFNFPQEEKENNHSPNLNLNSAVKS